jgi:hypothetical protein
MTVTAVFGLILLICLALLAFTIFTTPRQRKAEPSKPVGHPEHRHAAE